MTLEQLPGSSPSKAIKNAPWIISRPPPPAPLTAAQSTDRPPSMRNFAQDIAGTAKGSWLPVAWLGQLPFLNGVESQENLAISLSNDSVNPSSESSGETF